MILNDDKLKELSFLEYLKYMKEKVGDISHTSKSNNGYKEAKIFIRHIIGRYVKEYNKTWQNYMQDEEGSMLFNDDDILTKYGISKSDKQKKDVIEEFKDNISDDLFHMIMAREPE